MEIFGIGLPEVLVIVVVALVVLGPDRLPEAARTLGKGIADFRRAIEPARAAWEDVSREITTTVQSATADITDAVKVTGNPWTVHPIAEGLSDDERTRFFKTGALPDWKLKEMAEKGNVLTTNGTSPEATGDLPELDYPMPHAQLAYQPAPPFQPAEELDYPEPGNKSEEETNG